MNIEEKENSLLVKNIHSRVRSSFEEFGLVNAKLVVAVSGGSDSQTLLHVLNSIKDDLSIESCNQRDMSMYLTGTRHFYH